MASVDMGRVDRVLDVLEREHPGAQLLVNDPWSIYYLAGFYNEPYERFGGMLLARGQRPVIYNNVLNPLAPFDNADVVEFSDTDDTIAAIASRVDPARALGVDATMRSGFLVPLQERRVASSFFLGSFATTEVRERKDAEERRRMREASRLNDQAVGLIAEHVREGVTERELARELADVYAEIGADGLSFDPIVSFGANAANPHHTPDGTRLASGDVVLFDIGCRYQGYCSDMTRTFLWGEPDEESLRIHDVVRRANEAAEAAIREGMRFCDLDRVARSLIEDEGYGPYFTHRLGHGIGLQEHEGGDVSSANEAMVEPGMCFSIEPGIYLPGRTGVRIEDLVLMTEDGAEVLNAYPKHARRLDE